MMGDTGPDVPASGDVQSGEQSAGGAQSGPPPAQPAQHGQDEETGGGSNTTCIILGLVGGCGCLLIVLLALGIIGGVSWSLLGEPTEPDGPPNGVSPPPEIEIREPAEPPEVTPPAAPPARRRPTEATDVGPRPGESTALQWASNRRSDWDAMISDHSDDWTWVRLVMRPSEPEWTTWLELEWDHATGQYTLIDEGPIAQDEPEPQTEDVPDIYQPGEEVAKEAALGYAEQPDWVAKVVENSADWRQVTVRVGPPASEWVWEIGLRWNGEIDCYEMTQMTDVPYP